MARIFLLLAIVLGIFWWLRSRADARQAADRAADRATESARRPAGGDEAIEPMVQCAHCGVHLPRADAIAWHGLHYCRRSHLPDMPGEGSA